MQYGDSYIDRPFFSVLGSRSNYSNYLNYSGDVQRLNSLQDKDFKFETFPNNPKTFPNNPKTFPNNPKTIPNNPEVFRSYNTCFI